MGNRSEYHRNRYLAIKAGIWSPEIEFKSCLQCGGDMSAIIGAARNRKYCFDCMPDERRDYWRACIRQFGVDYRMWMAMYFEQDGTCLICGEKEATDVDHDHVTGRVRGLLCRGCNIRMGHLEDFEWRVKADKYLEEA